MICFNCSLDISVDEVSANALLFDALLSWSRLCMLIEQQTGKKTPPQNNDKLVASYYFLAQVASSSSSCKWQMRTMTTRSWNSRDLRDHRILTLRWPVRWFLVELLHFINHAGMLCSTCFNMNNLLWNSVPSLAAGVILGSAFAVSGNMINDGEIALYIVNHACAFFLHHCCISRCPNLHSNMT